MQHEYVFTVRQTEYYLKWYDSRKEWMLTSNRKNYGGRRHMGAVRFFPTLDEIGEKIPSLKPSLQLITAPVSGAA